MARGPRIVAELGRPETPEETAERKAASSFAYRSSKTFRNLVTALLVTLVVVLVIVFAVPRGEAPPRPRIDVAAVAEQAAVSYGRDVIAPAVPGSWLVNGAEVAGDDVTTWTVVYAPDDLSFVRVSQGFDADPAWATRVLRGARDGGTVNIGGIEWTRYETADATRAANVTTALGTHAGRDGILIYGSATAETAERIASGLADQIRELRREGA